MMISTLFALLWVGFNVVGVVFAVLAFVHRKDKEKFKAKAKLSGVTILISVVFLVLCAATASDDENSVGNNEVREEEQDEEKEELATIYKYNDEINSYFNGFNKANPYEPITPDIPKPYNHHGSDHKDQAKYYVDGFEVVVSTTGSGLKIYIGYIPNKTHTDEEYRKMFVKYLSGFNFGLSQEEIQADWDRIMNDLNHSVEFANYEASIYKGAGDSIRYIEIEKKNR